MIVTKTPLRISFFGGGTDYPEYFSRHRGAVFGMAINKYTYLTLRELHNFFKVSYKIVYSRTEETTTISEIRHPAVRACLTTIPLSEGLEIHHIADWPARTGLGSSSSFTVGLLKALHAFKCEEAGADQLAREAIHIEREVIGERVGCQDQVWAAFGGCGTITFSGRQSFTYEPFPLSDSLEQDFSAHSLLVYLDKNRFAHEVLEEQLEKTAATHNDVLLAEMYDLVPAGREAFAHGDWSEFGTLLDRSWKLKRRLSRSISNPAIDEAYRKAREAGAWGGKLLGAGAGGFLYFVVPPHLRSSVVNALSPLTPAPFALSRSGSRLIYYENR